VTAPLRPLAGCPLRYAAPARRPLAQRALTRWALTLLAVLLAAGLRASSVEPWVGETRPYETVSYRELNIEGLAALGSNHQGGLRLDGGILDHWSLQGRWLRDDAAPGSQSWEAGTQLRLGDSGDGPVDVAGFATLGRTLAADAAQDLSFSAGLVLAKEVGGHSLALNLLYGSAQGLQAKAAMRSPYFWWTTQMGLEAQADSRVQSVTPQLSFGLPGDINLQLGARWSWPGDSLTCLLSLSYEIFPSP
jgi:hypothetical protein